MAATEDGAGWGVGWALDLENVVGCFKGDDEPWAGQSNREWAKGVVIKRNIDQGNYDYQWVSMDSIKAEYSY